MRIICEKYNRKMNIGEIVPHLVAYCGTEIIHSVLGSIMSEALLAYWQSPKKSWTDDSIAACANIAKIECSNCKNKGWKPYPITEGELNLSVQSIQDEVVNEL